MVIASSSRSPSSGARGLSRSGSAPGIAAAKTATGSKQNATRRAGSSLPVFRNLDRADLRRSTSRKRPRSGSSPLARSGSAAGDRDSNTRKARYREEDGRIGKPGRRALAAANRSEERGSSSLKSGLTISGVPGAVLEDIRFAIDRAGEGQRTEPGPENVPRTLLPDLLPNSVARDGTRTDRGRFRDRKSETNRHVLGRFDTRPDGRNRI